jgi:hypothetical protein
MASALKKVSVRCLSSVSTQMSVSVLVGITMVGLLPAHLPRRDAVVEVLRVRSVPLIPAPAAAPPEIAIERETLGKADLPGADIESGVTDAEAHASVAEDRADQIETGAIADPEPATAPAPAKKGREAAAKRGSAPAKKKAARPRTATGTS